MSPFLIIETIGRRKKVEKKDEEEGKGRTSEERREVSHWETEARQEETGADAGSHESNRWVTVQQTLAFIGLFCCHIDHKESKHGQLVDLLFWVLSVLSSFLGNNIN